MTSVVMSACNTCDDYREGCLWSSLPRKVTFVHLNDDMNIILRELNASCRFELSGPSFKILTTFAESILFCTMHLDLDSTICLSSTWHDKSWFLGWSLTSCFYTSEQSRLRPPQVNMQEATKNRASPQKYYGKSRELSFKPHLFPFQDPFNYVTYIPTRVWLSNHIIISFIIIHTRTHLKSSLTTIILCTSFYERVADGTNSFKHTNSFVPW